MFDVPLLSLPDTDCLSLSLSLSLPLSLSLSLYLPDSFFKTDTFFLRR